MDHFKRFSKAFLMSLILFYCNNCWSQNEGVEVATTLFKSKQVIPPSPEAAQLGQYGNVPISLFTGTPNINIPITELKGNVLSLPVSLSYNAAGFKPEELATWTGLGWALNAGGVITRAVAGNPDVVGNYFTSPSPMDIPNTADNFAIQAYYDALRHNYKETQPDMYYYNFMGHAGKFLVKPDGSIFQKEKDMLSISSWGYTGNSFTIVDDNGFRYEFTATEQTTQSDVDDSPGVPSVLYYNYTSAWYLTKVTAPYGSEELILEYYSPGAGQDMYTNTIQNKGVSYSITTSDTNNFQNYIISSYATESQPPAVTIYKKFLSKITLKKNSIITGYIDFESTDNERQDLADRLLKKIKLYSTVSTSNILVKEFDLSYTYSATTNAHGEKRLLLQNVQEMSVASGTPDKPAFTFSYNIGLDMPGRFVSGLDHWGFYNGASNQFNGSPSLIPTVNISSNTFYQLYGNRGEGANREADGSFASICMLNKITYPTAGYTTFEYEGHDATFDNTYYHVGGIRIKKMIDYSFTDKPAVVKTYEYKKSNCITSGRIGTPARYDNYSVYNKGTPCDASGPTTTYTITLETNSIYPFGSVQGSHIGYETVTEYRTDLVTDQPLGRTVYSYNVAGFADADDYLGNGDLIKQEVFDNNGKLLQEQENTYQISFLEAMYRRKLRPQFIQSDYTILCDEGNNTITYHRPGACGNYPSCVNAYIVPTQYLVDDYSISRQYKLLSQQVNKVYDQLTNSYQTSTKKFTYGSNHTYPIKIEQTTSGNEVVVNEKKYVPDYSGGAGDNNALGINNLLTQNVLNAEIESVQYRQNSDGSNKRYINGSLTTYHTTLPLPVRFYRLEISSPLTSHTMSSTTNGNFYFSSYYKPIGSFVYNNNGNLIEQAKENDITTAYIWGYNNSYPVAQVVGASSNTAMAYVTNATLQSMSTTDATMRSEVNNIRTNLTSAIVTGYTYKPMIGLTSQSDANNHITSFEYDGLNRVTFIKDNDGNIVKNFRYNYGLGSVLPPSAQTLYFNGAVQQDFIKTGCGSGTYGDTITYKIPYGKYAALNLIDANAKALADLNTNGQNNANSLGLCRWYNAAKRVKIFKNDCLPQKGTGGFVWYIVPFGAFKSLINQTDADNLADADIFNNSQAYANLNASCSCDAPDKRYISDACVTSTTKYYVGWEEISVGNYRCYYKFDFGNGIYGDDILSEISSNTCSNN